MAENSLFNTYFEEQSDESVRFKGNKLIIIIPEEFIDRGVTTINQTTIITLGIFEGFIFDDMDEDDITKYNHKFISKLPTNLYMKPSHIEQSSIMVEDIEKDTIVKKNVYKLIFLKDDIYAVSTSIVKDSNVVDKFVYMLLQGQLPKTLTYSEVASIWLQCAQLNGVKTGSEFNTLAMIVMNLTRDPKNYSIPFRMVYDKYYSQGIYNGKMIRYMDVPRYISNFTSITGSDPRQGITVAMERIHAERNKDVSTPVEEIIR